MSPTIIHRFDQFFRFNVIKYENPHSKTLKALFLAGTGAQIAFHFKALKYHHFSNKQLGTRVL
jgi:hypothetical protein